MICTPKMWGMKLRIDHLEFLRKSDPNDYMVDFELTELKLAYSRLSQAEKLGLRVVQGGGQTTKPSTDHLREVS